MRGLYRAIVEAVPRRVTYAGVTMAADAASFVHAGGGFARDATRVWYRGMRFEVPVGERLFGLAHGYATDGARVFYGRDVIDADPASFEVIGALDNRVFARAGDRLLRDGKPCEGPDPATFRLLGAGIAVDRAGAWRVATFGRLDNLRADLASLRLLDEHYACDRARAWYRGEPIAGVDVPTFRVLGHRYAADDARVWRGGIELGVSPPELMVVDEHYTIIRGRLCYEGAPLEDADATTFRSLGNKLGKDAGRVYFDGDVIASADPASFDAITHDPGGGWVRDRERVWYRIWESYDYSDSDVLYEVEGAAATFRVIDDVYACCGGRVYRGQHPLEGADAATFRALGGNWYADATALWYGGMRLASAAPASLAIHGDYALLDAEEPALQSLGDGFAGATDHVLFGGRIVEGPAADRARSLGGGYLVDARHAWFYELATESRKVPEYLASGGRLAGAEPAALRRDRAFALDDDHVFAGITRLDADARTFRALDGSHGRDARRAYYEAQRIACDPDKLRVLGGAFWVRGYTLATQQEVDDAYATDGTTLFLRGRPIWDSGVRYLDDDDAAKLRRLDVAHLRVLDRWYATDERAVVSLLEGRVIDCDAATFTALGNGYARDRAMVIAPQGRLDADPDAFRVLADGYATDGTRYWYEGHGFAHTGVLEVLGGGWARDDAGVLYGSLRVAADPRTFVVVGAASAGESQWDLRDLAIDDPLWLGPRGAIGRDKDRLWWSNYRNDAPASAVVIAHGYALTDTDVYFAGVRIEADAPSFEAIGGGYARDAYRTYYQGEVTR